MALLGNLIARSLQVRKQFKLPVAAPQTYQRHALRQLLERGQYTAFGKFYGFREILSEEVDFIKAYRQTVPMYTYDEMHKQWWYRCRKGEENVSWPGKIKYFALSSGTSESASKHIPVTQDMIKSIKNVGFKQLYSMANFQIPSVVFEKGILMLGGTTSLFEKGEYYEGDMSGISAKNMPRWISSLRYKPGQKISKQPNWEERISLIVEKAPTWDVGIVCGVPAWVQIVLERVVKHHGAKNIHDIWPNLHVYIHGGVSIEPYRESFKKLWAEPVIFIETYMASEGSFGFQARPDGGIKLVLNSGVFFEFIPFTAANFDEEGNPRPNPTTYLVEEVQQDVEYAVMITTCSGAWRYIIGDVIRFTDVKEYEIAIVGRTKQFLSLCGEHMSIDNMNKAIETVARELKITINEFTVSGLKYDGMFAHKWYIGYDTNTVDTAAVRKVLDDTLCVVNDDYAVERKSAALKEVFVEMIPNHVFYDYMREKGKEGAMNKFPRVLRGNALKEWEEYLLANKITVVNDSSSLTVK